MYLSVIIPTLNEERNVLPLYKELKGVLDSIEKQYEIIFVDDGSTDSTVDNLQKIVSQDRNVKVIKLRMNFGQTAAWKAGFDHSKGELIAVMDADLQNDPKEIPRMIKKIDQGYDVVSGWRYNRKDPFFKQVFSFFANKLRMHLTKEKIHDAGCALKLYRKECLQDVELMGEVHRYITALLSWKGYKITELKVNHRHRRSGKTKYSSLRLFKGFVDLLMVIFWKKYSKRPLHLFGFIGFFSSFVGFLLIIYSAYLRIFRSVDLSDTFLPLAGIFLVLMGINLLVFGILADIMIKTYYKGTKPYFIEKIYEKKQS